MAYSMGIYYQSKLIMENIDSDGAFCTFSFMPDAQIDIDGCDGVGEFVFLGDDVDVDILNSDEVLLWLGFPPGSGGELKLEFEEGELVDRFTFPNNAVYGIDLAPGISAKNLQQRSPADRKNHTYEII